jgi:rubrerythrin
MRDRARKLAIEFEQAQRKFYLEAAVKADDPRAARLFASLALEELEHHLQWEEALPRPSPDSVADQTSLPVAATLRELFPETGQPGSVPGDSWSPGDLSALQSALASEQRGLDLYDQFRNSAPSAEDRAFLDLLKNQEGSHLSALRKLCDRETAR